MSVGDQVELDHWAAPQSSPPEAHLIMDLTDEESDALSDMETLEITSTNEAPQPDRFEQQRPGLLATWLSGKTPLAFLFVEPRYIECLLFAWTILSTAFKTFFAVIFLAMTLCPRDSDFWVSSSFNGEQYLVHASLYFAVVLALLANTVLMIYKRMNKTFIDNTEILRFYVGLDMVVLSMQLGIYFLYQTVRNDDLTSVVVAQLMIGFLVYDLFLFICYNFYECSINARSRRMRVLQY